MTPFALSAVPDLRRVLALVTMWRLAAVGVAGAVLYSAGTEYYCNRRGYRHAHGTWHLFVLGGTASHYIAIAGFVL